MKRLIRLVSTLAVAGLAFTYTGCTDYSEDVNRLDERIDGQIATTEEQYKNLQEEDGKLRAAIDAANTSIKALQDNTTSLQSELTALKEKHVADITALSKEHAADKAALELMLTNKANELNTKITELDGEYATKLAEMESAYKQADTELRSLISQNTTKISALESSVKNINEVVIPEVKDQISKLKDEAAKTYATKEELAAAKTELSKATADAIAKVNEEIGKLDERLKTVEKDLKDLSDAHESLKTSFEDTKANHESRIANLETSLATLEKTHADDVTVLRGLISDAKTAADNAQKAADGAKTAADNAQTTADNAVAAAAAAQTAADNAQKTASEALGKVDKLIAALGSYAEDGILAAKIEDLVNADNALAEKDILLAAEDARLATLYDELAKKDTEFAGLIEALQNTAAELEKKYGDIAGKVADLEDKDITLEEKDAELEKLIDGLTKEDVKIYAEIQKTNAKVADVEQAIKDAKTFCLNKIAELSETLQENIKEVYNYTEAELAKKFDKSEFVGSFSEAFKTAFDGENYEEAFNRLFSGKLTEADGEFSTTVNGLFTEAFKTAFDGMNYTDAFNDLFKTALASEGYRNDFDEKFNDFLDAALLPEGKVGEKFEKAARDLQDAVDDLKDNYITPLETKVDDAIARIDKRAGDIILVIGDLANRIQSVTFVPEYDDMCASLYYYYIFNDGKSYPLSDKTVVASFEVYPRTQAENVAKMLENGAASIVAVPLKHSFTRGAAEAAVATIKKPVVVNNGIVKVEAVFGEGVDYELPEYPSGTPVISSAADHASSFAIALRVEAPAETEINTVDKDGNATVVKKDAGKYIESAYVPVRLSVGCDLSDAFELYDFDKEVLFPENLPIEREWSDAPAKENYFKDYEYAVYIADFRNGETFEDAKYRTIDEAAAIMNVDPAKITPEYTIVAKGSKDYFNPVAGAKDVVKFDGEGLDAPYIEMNKDNVVANPKDAVGSHMIHTANFSLAGVKSVIPTRTIDYKIIKRTITFEVKVFKDENLTKWSYKKAKELTKVINSDVAYDKPIVFDECSVTKKQSEESKFKDTVISLGDLLDKSATYEVTVNGEADTKAVDAGLVPIVIEKVADKVEDVAKVTIPGLTYTFAQGVQNDYLIKATYSVAENATDYIVSFEHKLGAMAKDQTVTLPVNKKFTFDSKKKEFQIDYTEAEYLNPIFKAIGGYFENNAKTLWASVNEMKVDKNSSVTAVIAGKKITIDPSKSSTSTDISVLPEGVCVVVDRSDLSTFNDTFDFVATCDTWYGVKYTFKTDGALEFEKPDFMLAPAPDRLTSAWKGKILPEDNYNKYVLTHDIDLSKYVIVVGLDGKQKEITEDMLTIRYEQLIKNDDIENGILRAPKIAPEKETVHVIPNAAAPKYPTIESSFINWLTLDRAASFTARYDEIGATLYLDGIKLGDQKVMKLSTARPITKFAFDKVVEEVPFGSKAVTVNLWNNMIIEGVLEEGNVVKQNADNLEKALAPVLPVGSLRSTAATYDCEVSFPEKDEVSVYVGGKKQSIYNLTKFEYNAADGVIIFNGDLSDLVKPVEFRFAAKLNYVLDYDHKQPMKATVSVTFKRAE